MVSKFYATKNAEELKKVTKSDQRILSIIDGQMMRHIRIFLIFVANTDRNENNYCCIRGSF